MDKAAANDWIERHQITTHKGRFMTRTEVRRVCVAKLNCWRGHDWEKLVPIGKFVDRKLDDAAWMRSRRGMVATAIGSDIVSEWIDAALELEMAAYLHR